MVAPSGDQFSISYGPYRAVVTEVGASLRVFERGGSPILWGYGHDEMAPFGRGQVLFPWPNRLEDGSFVASGRSANAPLDEPERHNAIHGLVRWLAWNLLATDESSVCLGCVVVAQPAYPFRLAIEVTYRVGDDGLSVTTVVTNHDIVTAPFGLGFHPYFTPGRVGVDAAELFVRAKTALVMDERGLPIGVEPSDRRFAGLVSDGGAAIGPLVLDDCFTDLARSSDGRFAVRFTPSDGDAIVLWGDESFTHVMCFSADTLPGESHRAGVAIEPMTCAPNALHSGEGVISLLPGATHECRWGIGPVAID